MEPQPSGPAAEHDAPETIPRQRPIVSVKELVLQLVIVTAGVLIALLIDSLVEWNHYRSLVREARANLALEIGDNKKEAESVLAGAEVERKNIENALRFANELLKDRKTEIRTLNLGLNLAELSSASWQTAERTGALAHMEYADVQRYSRLYGFQDLFTDHQRRALQKMTDAMSILSEGDPTNSTPADLERFKEHVRALGAELGLLQDFARRLVENYQEALQAP